MTEEQQAAYVMAMAAVLNAEVAGMVAENHKMHYQGHNVSHDEQAFQALIEKSGCHHNDVLGMFRG